MLDVSKAIQESDILVKIIKANENSSAEAIFFNSNKSLENGKFPNYLKLANITSVFKKGTRTSKKPIEQLVSSLFFQRFLKDYLVDNF